LCGKEIEYIREALNSNWVTTVGPNLNAFEKDIEVYLGNQSCALALNSGTAAIHLGLLLLGVTPGDEVVCQSFTYAASTNPIYYLGAKPVFVDSEPNTWNMSPEHLQLAIEDRIGQTGKKPAAIIAVHLYGMPAKIDEIIKIANQYQIPVLEDAAEALGSMYKRIKCGTFGDIAAVSFNGNKIITTSGGGVLLSGNEAYIKQARFFSTQARDAAPHYQHSHIGYNYRMSNVLAGIGRGQMEVLPLRIERRREINRSYRSYLSDIKGITFQTEPSPDFFSNYWLTALLVDPAKTGGITRDDLITDLETANIEARPLWKPMHLQPVFSDCPYYGNDTCTRLFENGLCLPSSSILTDDDILRVAEILRMATLMCAREEK
jgi:dTDP-4-amino-4,6-dideoxygalactose transaminase